MATEVYIISKILAVHGEDVGTHMLFSLQCVKILRLPRFLDQDILCASLGFPISLEKSEDEALSVY